MTDIINAITKDPVLIFLPIIIGINVILGVIAAIKTKTFDAKKLPKFMLDGVLYLAFMIVMNLIYEATLKGDFGSIAEIAVQGLRGVAWVFTIVRYGKSIYDDLVKLGLKRNKAVEEKLDDLCGDVAAEAGKEALEEINSGDKDDSNDEESLG